MDSGLAGLVAAETVLSHSDGARGILWVRGHTLADLAANFGYDGAVGLLWEGFAGEGLDRAAMRGTADDLLRMAHGAPAEFPGDLPAAAAMAAALDTYFCAVIDNGLNTSAFTARVIASSRASLVSAALGAYCAFTGPLHGGAPGPTLDMLDDAAASGDVASWAEQKLAAGERLMGFGHRVFRLGDPRALVLRQALERLGESLGPGAGRLAFAAEVEHAVGAAFARLKPDRPPLQPNIEINAALLLDAVGLPRDAFTPVFAVARGAGWLAHAMEQQTTGPLIRPSSAYVGPRPKGVASEA